MNNERKAVQELSGNETDYDFSEDFIRQLENLGKQATAKLQEEDKELVLWTAIAGLFHYVDVSSEEGKKLLASLQPGTELLLRREPDNKYDHWAVAVETKDHIKIGFITRFKNETIARMMDYGHHFEAKVESIKDNDKELPEKQRAATEQMMLPFSVWLVN